MTAEKLARRLGGELVLPGNAHFDSLRHVWNGMVNERPVAIARCVSADDVAAALAFARHNRVPVTVRGGGHGVAGQAVRNGALLVDLSPMRGVRVDASRRTAQVDAGATWGLVDAETQRHGLAVTGGIDSRTGVAGLTLGGGMGYLARSLGLTIDNVLALDAVLVDGRTVTVSESQHPDLFWAMRGGGGNFGVVTGFTYRLHPVGPELATAQVFYGMDQAAQVLQRYDELMVDAPDEITCYIAIVNVPSVEPFPVERHGRPALALIGCYVGDVERGGEALAPLATFGDPFVAAFAPTRYCDLQQSFDAAAPDGGRYYWKAGYLDGLSSEAIATLLDHLDSLPGPFSNVFLESMGGAITRVDPAATAFPHRHVRFGFGISSGWADPSNDEAAIAWTRRLHDAMAPHCTGGVYANYLDGDDDARVTAAYRSNLDRLRQVKSTYDPDNVLRFNVNVPPAA